MCEFVLLCLIMSCSAHDHLCRICSTLTHRQTCGTSILHGVPLMYSLQLDYSPLLHCSLPSQSCVARSPQPRTSAVMLPLPCTTSKMRPSTRHVPIAPPHAPPPPPAPTRATFLHLPLHVAKSHTPVCPTPERPYPLGSRAVHRSCPQPCHSRGQKCGARRVCA